MEDILDDLAAKVKHDVVVTCSKVAAMHVSATQSEDYNRAAREIAAKLLELNNATRKRGRAA